MNSDWASNDERREAGLATSWAADGTAAHAGLARLVTSAAPARDLSDAVHALCAVHGPHPGMIDAALVVDADRPAHGLLVDLAAALSVERVYLARLAAAAGPLPSTPGQAESGTTLVTMRQSLLLLARSERVGCATGAVAALAADWAAIRLVLDAAAERFGLASPSPMLPSLVALDRALGLLRGSVAVERAKRFGSEQVLAQHRGLWSMLDARAAARDAD